MKQHPFALAFSERRMSEPNFNVRRAPTQPKRKPTPLPASTKPVRWEAGKPQFADDLLVGAISHLLRHEHDGQSIEEHDVSESVLDCVLALCEFFEERITPEPSEEIQFKAGQILRLLEVSAERGQSVHDLILATELDPGEVLEAVRYLQNSGVKIRSEISYESRYLELVFLLDMHQWRSVR
jgi:hypothetical protein